MAKKKAMKMAQKMDEAMCEKVMAKMMKKMEKQETSSSSPKKASSSKKVVYNRNPFNYSRSVCLLLLIRVHIVAQAQIYGLIPIYCCSVFVLLVKVGGTSVYL